MTGWLWVRHMCWTLLFLGKDIFVVSIAQTQQQLKFVLFNSVANIFEVSS